MSSAEERSRRLRRALLDGGAALVGFADLGRVADAVQDYTFGICFALPYSPEGVDPLPYDAPFLAMADRISRQSNRLYGIAEELLEDWGYRHERISSHLPADELPNLSERLPQKTVATLAGLGWIGKSTLLISPDFGARIRLSALVTDAILTPGEPVLRSECGECRSCADACPVGAIRNSNWSQGVSRHLLIDIHRCNDYLWERADTLGRKQICGLCLKACPVARS